MKWRTAVPALLLCCPACFAPSLHAQDTAPDQAAISIPSAAPNEVSLNSDAVYATPPTFTLIPHGARAHPGAVWVRSTAEGLHLWVKAQADASVTRWPLQKSEILSSDHVEVWLATAAQVTMPPIGWGNQFGTTTLHTVQDCAAQDDSHTGDLQTGVRNCERWFNEQVQYRQTLQHLFARQWLITSKTTYPSSYVFEDFAATAYNTLTNDLFPEDIPIALRPRKDEKLTAEPGADSRMDTLHDAAGNPYTNAHQTAYKFHIFIPYTAFPPTQQLTLKDLYLMVDVFSAAPAGRKMGDLSTSSPTRQWGKPSTFNHVQLTSPRTFSITPCQEKPEATDLYGVTYNSWFFPTPPDPAASVKNTFALMNPAAGYLYDPGGVSPQAQPSSYFWKETAAGATVCGPNLAWRKGQATTRSEFNIDEKYLQTRSLVDGWTLVRSGPFTTMHSAFGSGQCGSCPVGHLDIFAISPAGAISSALTIDQDLSGEGDNPISADLSIDSNWERITFYTNQENEADPNPKPDWDATTFCLASHSYQPCAQSKHVQPPNPPNFKELGQDQ